MRVNPVKEHQLPTIYFSGYKLFRWNCFVVGAWKAARGGRRGGWAGILFDGAGGKWPRVERWRVMTTDQRVET